MSMGSGAVRDELGADQRVQLDEEHTATQAYKIALDEKELVRLCTMIPGDV